MERIAPELLDAILLFAVGGPHGFDYDDKRDIRRMKLLKAVGRVCRHWRAIAGPLLPACIVFRSGRQVGLFYKSVHDGNVDDSLVRTLVIAPDEDAERYSDLIWARMRDEEGDDHLLSAQERHSLYQTDEYWLLDGAEREAKWTLLIELVHALVADVNYLAQTLPNLEAVCLPTMDAVSCTGQAWPCRRLVIGSASGDLHERMDWESGDDTAFRDGLERSGRVREVVFEHYVNAGFNFGSHTSRRLETLTIEDGALNDRTNLGHVFKEPAIRLKSLAVFATMRVSLAAFGAMLSQLRPQMTALRKLEFDWPAWPQTHEAVMVVLRALPRTLRVVVIRYFRGFGHEPDRSSPTSLVMSDDDEDRPLPPSPRKRFDPVRELAAAIEGAEKMPALHKLALSLPTGADGAAERSDEAWAALQTICDARGIELASVL